MQCEAMVEIEVELPVCLYNKAVRAGLDLSKVLQDYLINELGFKKE